MKKLVFALLISLGAGAASAQEATTSATPVAKPAPVAPPAVTNKPVRTRPPFDRARFEAQIAARKAERAAQIEEVLKKYGLEGEKAKSCAQEILELKLRRPPRPGQKPEAKTTAK